MAVATKKVTRNLVTLLNQFVEVRAMSNLYRKQVDDYRDEIFAEVGKVEQTLTHNGVDVAIISKVEKSVLDLDLLKEKYPEAYQASLVKRPEFHIRKATPKK
jgi:hypothetical protein